MTFDSSLLETYRTLLNTTPLQQSYQEFVRLFRYLRSELERQLPDFRFQSGICENAMVYAYFSLTSPALKEKGWKLVVVFIHKSFQLEVWLSGSNRSIQRQWANRLNACPPPMEASADPGRTEYLIRLPVQTDLTNGKGTAAAIRKAVKDLTEFLSSQGGTIWESQSIYRPSRAGYLRIRSRTAHTARLAVPRRTTCPFPGRSRIRAPNTAE